MKKRCIVSSIFLAGIIILQLSAQDNTRGIGANERKTPVTAAWTDRARFCGKGTQPATTKNVLWYRQSAQMREEALPLGNGHLGAMVFGGVTDERIQLNENTLWDGFSLDPNNPEGHKALPEVQRLLFENKNNEAVKLAEATMMGNPKGVKSYQSLGELWFDTPELEAYDYVRALDLSTAISTVNYTANDVKYTREYFAPAPDNVIVLHITADKQNKINLSLTLKRERNAKSERLGNDGLLLTGQTPARDAQGNFGATAAIAEMLVQSHLKRKNGRFEIHLLSSLPSAMARKGSVKGIKGRGGFVIDLDWEKGALTKTTIYSESGGELHLRTGNIRKPYKLQKSETINVDAQLKIVKR